MSHLGTTPVVLVTGASRGLGRGIAVELAREGCSVAINYCGNLKAAEETVSLCTSGAIRGDQIFFPIQGDIASSADRSRLLESVLERFGRLDALVNNAGIAPRSRHDILQAEESSFEELVRTNLQGPYFLTHDVARYWIEQRPAPMLASGFKVVFITSISADTASLNRGDYCITKAGLAMAAQLWAVRLAGEGIQVVELRPGIMATDMTAGVKEKYDKLLAEGLVPQRRWGTADDVGRAVRSVIAGHLPFSTGAVIPIDGGFHLRRL